MSGLMVFGIALLVVGVIVVLLVGLPVLAITAGVFPIWIKARSAGVEISLFQLFGMKLRRLDPARITDNLIEVTRAGIEDVNSDSLEAHVLAGGNLEDVVQASISAHKADLGASFAQLCAIDLAGRNVARAIDACVNPQIINCPAIAGVARDGIRVQARVRITVRSNIKQLVGGAGEQTVIARVGQGVVSAVGAAASYRNVQQTPEVISQYILAHGLASGTAFEILSVDVLDVEVQDNVGARLAGEQAETDKKVAQARAESRRAGAVATEREMHARVVEMTAQLTANKATLPLAMATACREGRLWRSPRPLRAAAGERLWDPNAK